MSYFLRSETLSTCAGLTFPLRDVRDFSSTTPSVSILNKTKKIFGKRIDFSQICAMIDL